MNIENALKIRGWMSTRELEFLAKMASESKYIIEVGCFEGRSTRAMADNTKGTIFAVDPWNVPVYSDNGCLLYETNDTIRHIFYKNLWDKIKSRTIIVCPMQFIYLDDFICMNTRNFDFIFIDADHRYENVKRDIKHALKFNPAIISGHDYCKEWPGVIRAVDEIFPNSDKEDTIWYQKLR